MNGHKLALAGDPPDDLIDAPDDTPWRVSDSQALMWAVGQLADASEEERRDRALYAAAKERLDAWLAARLDAIAHQTAYLRAEVERYATENRDTLVKGKTKTIDLPTGTISWRKTGGKLTVTDKEALAKWAVAQGPESALYRVKVEPDLRALQEFFKRTGEIPDGADVEPEVETISIKPSQPLLPKENP